MSKYTDKRNLLFDIGNDKMILRFKQVGVMLWNWQILKFVCQKR